ncbi:unnamed protein product [Arctia plantaginis]|uniref:Uncharacterized protein n=1 Tax=Arctia plantaginis TaxID=874455 RepID=A0A8S1BML4_ARCPL|nr:unnamed protein product [Arctia plantaginis]
MTADLPNYFDFSKSGTPTFFTVHYNRADVLHNRELVFGIYLHRTIALRRSILILTNEQLGHLPQLRSFTHDNK